MGFLLAIGFALVSAFICVVILAPTRRDKTNDAHAENSYEKSFRIVELQNGMYRVERWNNYLMEWETPFGHYTCDTLEAAKVKKAQLIADRQEADGYRFKRVVD
jgi:hypothetical protein